MVQKTGGVKSAGPNEKRHQLSLEVSSRIREEVSKGGTNLLADLIRIGADNPATVQIQPGFEPVRLDMNGLHFGVTYVGRLPEGCVAYLEANEKFDRHTFRAIGRISGINHFLGITGGFNYPLSIVLNLQQRNSLETCTFVDDDAEQCFNAIVMVLRFDRYLSNNTTTSNFEPHLFFKHALLGRHLPYAFDFRNEDIMQEVVLASGRGRYFIYLSNAYRIGYFPHPIIPGSNGMDETKTVWKAILENRNIEPGSYILSVKPFSSQFVMLRKEQSGFSVPYFHCGGKMNMEVLEALLRAE